MNHLEQANLLYQQKRYDLALKMYEGALAANPDSSEALCGRALCLSHLKRHSQAVQSAVAAVGAAPDSAWAHYVQSLVLARKRDYKRARVSVENTLRLAPEDPDYLALAGSIALGQKRWKEAQALAEQGLAANSGHRDCLNVRAEAMIHLGQGVPARDSLLEALEHDPSDARTLANLGWIALRRASVQEALDFFTRALREDPESRYAREGLLEALRSRYPVYGLFVLYATKMSDLSERGQVLVVLLTRYVHDMLKALGRRFPKLEPLCALLSTLWSIFTYLNWVARAVTNLLLRTNPYSRRLLSQDELDESSLIGLALLGAGVTFVASKLTGITALWVACLILWTITMPVSGIYNVRKGKARTVLQVATAALLCIGLAAAWFYWDRPLSGPAAKLLKLYVSGMVTLQYAIMALTFYSDRVTADGEGD